MLMWYLRRHQRGLYISVFQTSVTWTSHITWFITELDDVKEN